MNKLAKSLLAILGACSVIMEITSPIFIAIIWASITPTNWATYTIFWIGFLAALFRAIKIGWMK